MPDPTPTSLATAIDKRREEIDGGLLLRELADRADISVQTLISIRERDTPPSARQRKNERKLEAALGWAAGSLQAIREGREPTPIQTESRFEGVADLEEAIKNDPDLDDEAKRTLIKAYRAYRNKPLDVCFARLVRN